MKFQLGINCSFDTFRISLDRMIQQVGENRNRVRSSTEIPLKAQNDVYGNKLHASSQIVAKITDFWCISGKPDFAYSITFTGGSPSTYKGKKSGIYLITIIGTVYVFLYPLPIIGHFHGQLYCKDSLLGYSLKHIVRWVKEI